MTIPTRENRMTRRQALRTAKRAVAALDEALCTLQEVCDVVDDLEGRDDDSADETLMAMQSLLKAIAERRGEFEDVFDEISDSLLPTRKG